MTASPWLVAAPPRGAAGRGRRGRARVPDGADQGRRVPTLLAGDEAAWAGVAYRGLGTRALRDALSRASGTRSGLFLRFDADDAAPWHTMTKRDEHLWEEEVVEIFLDLDRSGRDYAELEINPANVVCDVRMISPCAEQEGRPRLEHRRAWRRTSSP